MLVDPAVSAAKFDREVDAWRRHEVEYRKRGWILLRAEPLEAEIAFVGLLPLGAAAVPFVAPTIRLRYDNYDLWPPELTFIDFFSGRPAPPPIGAFLPHPDGGRPILITRPGGRFFLCHPGTRGYHTDTEHDGDVWHLYRHQGRGSLAVVAELVYEAMTDTVAGVSIQIQTQLMVPPLLPVDQARALSDQRRRSHDQIVDQFGAALSAENESSD